MDGHHKHPLEDTLGVWMLIDIVQLFGLLTLLPSWFLPAVGKSISVAAAPVNFLISIPFVSNLDANSTMVDFAGFQWYAATIGVSTQWYHVVSLVLCMLLLVIAYVAFAFGTVVARVCFLMDRARLSGYAFAVFLRLGMLPVYSVMSGSAYNIAAYVRFDVPFILAIILMVLYGCQPFVYGLVVFLRRYRLDRPFAVGAFGSLYQPYTKENYIYFALRMLRRVCIGAILGGLSLYPLVCYASLVAVLAISIITYVARRPARSVLITVMEVALDCVFLFSVAVAFVASTDLGTPSLVELLGVIICICFAVLTVILVILVIAAATITLQSCRGAAPTTPIVEMLPRAVIELRESNVPPVTAGSRGFTPGSPISLGHIPPVTLVSPSTPAWPPRSAGSMQVPHSSHSGSSMMVAGQLAVSAQPLEDIEEIVLPAGPRPPPALAEYGGYPTVVPQPHTPELGPYSTPAPPPPPSPIQLQAQPHPQLQLQRPPMNVVVSAAAVQPPHTSSIGSYDSPTVSTGPPQMQSRMSLLARRKQTQSMTVTASPFVSMPNMEVVQPQPDLATQMAAMVLTPNTNSSGRVHSGPSAFALNVDTDSNSQQMTREWLEKEARQKELDHFDKVLSHVCDGVFVGSHAIASNKQMLMEQAITHIVNCVGQHHQNYFADTFNYLTYFLADAQSEVISAVFYEVLDFLLEAVRAGGRVMIHCNHGISRSAALAVLYLMYTKNLNYDDALARLTAARPVVKPNIGFVFQLQEWHDRMQRIVRGLAPPLADDVRLYRVTHQSRQHAVSRLVAKPVVDRSGKPCAVPSALDPRFVFVLQPIPPRPVWVWVGEQASPAHLNAARLFVWRLQRYENAPRDYRIIQQGREPDVFWNLFNSAAAEYSGAAAAGAVRVQALPREENDPDARDDLQRIDWQPLPAVLFRAPQWLRISPFSVLDFDSNSVLGLLTCGSVSSASATSELLLWVGCEVSFGSEPFADACARLGRECKLAVGLRDVVPVKVIRMTAESQRVWNYVPRCG